MILIFLNQTESGTVVQSWIQRGILMTGILQPDLALPEEEQVVVNLDIPMRDAQNNRVSPAAFRGKTIFMNIWASWCAPCLAEMPLIQDLFTSVDSDDVEFIMLSTDADREAAQAYINRRGFSFPVYYLDGPLSPPLDASILPTTYIIDGTGRLLVRHAGMANYDSDRVRTFLLDHGDGS